MFELPDVKLFRDVIHGYIKVPCCFIENIIDTAMFQRLRNIDQTGMRVLYPDAKHDRFGHSLGVFHLGCQAVDALLNNFRSSSEQKKSKHWYVRSDDSLNAFWAKNKVLFLIACLLHDIGHAPFSHALENEMHRNSDSDGKAAFDEILADKLSVSLNELLMQRPAPHEKMGAYLILRLFKEPVRRILNYLKEDNYPRRHLSPLVIEPETGKSYVDSDDLEEDLCFIARMVLGLKYPGFQPEQQIKNCFIELLNGSMFDVDKLDYIMRDTYVSGIKNASIDAERLLSSINIVALTEYKAEEETNEKFIDRTLIQRIQANADNTNVTIDGYIDGTLIIEKGAQVEINVNTVIQECKKAGEKEAKLARGSDSRFRDVSDRSSLIIDGNLIQKESEDYRRIPKALNESCACMMRELKVEEHGFKFAVTQEKFALTFKGICTLHITGKFMSHSPIVISKKADGPDSAGIIKGTHIRLTIVGDRLQDSVPTEKTYNTFSVGFHKSAIGNISAVLDARDNLYRWIYAHHKVMYYANFLIPVIAQAVLMDRLKCPLDKAPSVDDSLFWACVKEHYNETGRNKKGDIERLIAELVERKYKKSLFKSLAEYDVLFESFDDEKKKIMYNTFKKKIEKGNSKPEAIYYLKFLDENGMVLKEPSKEIIAGFISKNFINQIFGTKEHEVSNLVWLAAQYKRKNINLRSTFIIYKNATTTLSRIDLLSNALAIPNSDTSHYFYLYFDVVTIKGESDNDRKQREEKVRKHLSDAIINFFSQ